MTNKKAAGLGAVGAVVGGLVVPGAGVGLGFVGSAPLVHLGWAGMLKGFAIGFALGSYLFPPEIEEPDVDEEDPTDASATDPVPVVMGRRTVSGNIIYFRSGERLRRKNGEDNYTYQAMQIAVCLGDKLRQARILDTEGRVFEQRCFFGVGKSKAPLAGPPPNQQPYGYYNESGNKTTDGIKLSQVVWSDGLSPNYFHDWFTDPDVGFIPSYPDGTGSNTQGSWPTWGQTSSGMNWILPDTFTYWPNDLPPLVGVCTAASPVWYLGNRAVSVPQMLFDVEVYPDLSDSTFPWQHVPDRKAYDLPGVNPAHAIWEIFTNKQWGMANSETMLDPESFVYCEDYFEAEGYHLNLVIDSPKSVQEVLTDILFHVNAMIRSNDEGKLELVLFRPLNVSPIVTGKIVTPIPGLPLVYQVKDHDIRDIAVESESWSEVDNEFVATFPSKDNKFEPATIGPLKNEASYAVTGQWKTAQYSFNYFTTSLPVQKRISQLFLQNSRPKIAVTFELDLRFHVLKKGDGIVVESADFGFDKDLDFPGGGNTDATGMTFRVMEISEPDIESNSIKIKAGIDMESFYASVYTAPPAGGGGGGSQTTSLTPLDIQAHTDWWFSFSATPDTISGFDWDNEFGTQHARPKDLSGTGKTYVFCNQIYSAQGSTGQTKVGYHLTKGPTIPYYNPVSGLLVEALPETSAITTKYESPTFGYVFTSLTHMGGDDYMFSYADQESDGLGGYYEQGGKWLYLELRTPLSADVVIGPDDEPFAQAGYEDIYENDANKHWALVFAGVPNNVCRTEEYACVEVMRFGKFERVADAGGRMIYRVGKIQRSSNKESPQAWLAGSQVWIAQIDRALTKTVLGGDNTLWAHGFKGVAQGEFQSEYTGYPAIRLYAKGGDAQGYEDFQEGGVETYGRYGTNFYTSKYKTLTCFSPEMQSIAWRKNSMYPTYVYMDDAYKWRQDITGSTPDTWVIEVMPHHRNLYGSYPTGYGLIGHGSSPLYSNPNDWQAVQQKSYQAGWINEVEGPLIGTKYRLWVFIRTKGTSPNYRSELVYLRSIETSEYVSGVGANWHYIEYTPSAYDYQTSNYTPGNPGDEDVEAFHQSLVFVLQRLKKSDGGSWVEGQSKFVPKMGCMNYHMDLLDFGPGSYLSRFPLD